MTLDEFIAQLPQLGEAFKAATLHHAKTDETFVMERDEDDWFREMAAWSLMMVLEEKE
jgi:hypothetical protein